MAHIKIRLRFNPGRLGSPMGKLGEFATQTEKFLRALIRDFGIEDRNAKWLAQNFTNESVAFDSEYSEVVDEVIAAKAQKAIETLSGENPFSACENGVLSYPTVSEFARIGAVLDKDEFFLIGLYDANKTDLNWHQVTYRQTSEIQQVLDAPLLMYGSIQGVMHSWHSGAQPPFFSLRQSSDGELIRCDYAEKTYAKIHKAMQTPRTVIFAYGNISWDRITNKPTKVSVEDIEVSQPLSDFEFESFFGSAPSYTGALSTSDYISWLRGDDAE